MTNLLVSCTVGETQIESLNSLGLDGPPSPAGPSLCGFSELWSMGVKTLAMPCVMEIDEEEVAKLLISD